MRQAQRVQSIYERKQLVAKTWKSIDLSSARMKKPRML